MTKFMQNREIKFRVWYPEAKRHYVFNVNSFSVFFNGSLSELPSPDSNTAIQQFTGLKDFNCKDIYEGDIVKIHKDGSPVPILIKSPSVVTYHWGGFRIDGNNIDNWIMNETDAGFNIVAVEIIGNVFENPELLK